MRGYGLQSGCETRMQPAAQKKEFGRTNLERFFIKEDSLLQNAPVFFGRVCRPMAISISISILSPREASFGIDRGKCRFDFRLGARRHFTHSQRHFLVLKQ